MPSKILMPALSPTMEEGKLEKWLKKEGEQIRAGDMLAEIETDKAVIEYEATMEGVLGKILVKEGTEGVKVNEVIGILLEKGEYTSDIEAFEKTLSSSGNAQPEIKHETTPVSEVKQVQDIVYSGPTREVTVREALNEALSEELERDEKVYIMGEEVAEYQGAYKITQGLLQKFGAKRVIDTPITEYGFTGIAAGSAFHGLKPIVEFMTFNFAMQAIDHIVNSSAKTLYMSGGEVPSPIVFRGANGAAVGVAAQHSQNFASWYASVPGLKVVTPWSAEDAKGLLKSAIRDPNPVVFLENEILYGRKFTMPDEEDLIVPIGVAKVEKEGQDVTILAYSIGVSWAMEAAEKLAEEGIDAEIINLRSIKPLDLETIIQSVQKTGSVVIVDEAWKSFGVAAEISALIMENAFDYLDAPVLRVAGKDIPMPYSHNLERMALPSVNEIIEAVKQVTYKQG